ncbi:metal-sensing transcriptional repressor [Aliarcobacter lanthieri]|uniref:metal-sensing transcriptional repressor n=1 Tax=Aliarcobacter lanthieri TaxID=1355374 RepID=UPI00047ACB1B|nr:metal-sensing transcriptional repressor [Aliarcobacter lanthieri]QKF58645.1 transcriptional regulator, CsoR family [Aliarcobacter lanthieri]
MNEEKQKALQALKTAKGQIEAIIKMIEDGRYCIDISNQILAVSSLVKKSNILILKQHMNSCVLEAVNSGNANQKIDEITKILSKIIDK